PSTLSNSSSLAVSMMTGTLEVRRISRHTSVPLIPGSIRSSSTRSAPWAEKIRSPSMPLSATATSYPSFRSEYDSGSEKDSSSSTIRMRVMSVSLLRRLVGRRGVWIVGGSRGAGGLGAPRPHGDGPGAAHLGQPEREGRALAGQRPGGDLAAVIARDVLHDRQAQPGAAGRARAGAVHPEEPFEDPLQMVLGDADPLILHGDLDHAAVAAHGHPDAGAGIGIGDRVGDQVRQGGGEHRGGAEDLQALHAAHRDLDLRAEGQVAVQ